MLNVQKKYSSNLILIHYGIATVLKVCWHSSLPWHILNAVIGWGGFVCKTNIHMFFKWYSFPWLSNKTSSWFYVANWWHEPCNTILYLCCYFYIRFYNVFYCFRLQDASYKNECAEMNLLSILLWDKNFICFAQIHPCLNGTNTIYVCQLSTPCYVRL